MEKKVDILSVIQKPIQFLGSEVIGVNTPEQMFLFLKKKISDRLENLDKSTIRGEHKLKVYSRYILSSIRYYFSIHQVHQNHLQKLDDFARNFIKK